MGKKSFIIACLFLFMNALIAPAFPGTMMPAYIYEIGLKFYKQGRYEEALHEFKKALIIQPDFEPALKYIEIIRTNNLREQPLPEAEIEAFSPMQAVPASKPSRIAGESSSMLEATPKSPWNEIASVQPMIPLTQPESTLPPSVIMLDQTLKQILQPIEIPQNSSVILRGSSIQRYLATQPQVLSIEKTGPDELTLTGKQLGYTYLHVWDDSGRTTLEFFTAPPMPQGPTLEEEMLQEIQRAGNFKLRYYMDWDTYLTGRRLSNVERQFYYFNHVFSLNGATPYGDLDSTLTIRRQPKLTDVPYYTVGLEKGRYSFLNDFSLRFFDFTTGIYNQMFSNVYLRGAYFKTPVFHKLLEYTVFWGQDKAGTFGNLTTGAKAEQLDSYLTGVHVNFRPAPKQNYHVSFVHGYGDDRQRTLTDLKPYGYDAGFETKFERFGFTGEAAFDSKNFGKLASISYSVPTFMLSSEARDIDRDFVSMTGLGSRAGELGLLSFFTYTPTEKIYMNGQLDVFRDRLYPSLENENRWNEDLNWSTTYAFDQTASGHLDFLFQNELGRLSEIRYFSPGIGFNKTFSLPRRISTYLNYRYQHNQNFTSPGLDYVNHKISTGLRFNLLGELYYFLNHEFNWLDAIQTNTTSQPHLMETGFDWTGQVFQSPLKLNTTFLYHNEEDTVSPLSFLSGEDYIEGYAELTCPLSRNGETYFSTRVRNIWADNPDITKHIEAELRGGLRYTWDTGVRWEAIGTIEGYVFRDLNSDGLRQNDEPPIQNLTLWLGIDKYAVSDEFGYYKFERIKGKSASVMLDTTTVPAGYVLTVPVHQETLITNGGRSRLDFGMIARTEITGIVFEDVDSNNAFSQGDKPVKGVSLALENGTQAVSNETGRYIFGNTPPGLHTIALDINSVPVYYLPTVALKFDLAVSEGMPYQYNIPLKRVKE